jgi:5-methylcytosine-specific restriction endonuclease McrA
MHTDQGRTERRERNRFYDQHQRDAEAKRFYDSEAWKRARARRLASYPVCERCNREFARHVHHRIKLKDCTPSQRLDQDNLMSVCVSCHNAIEAEI